MNCAAFIIVTTSFLYLTDADNLYYSKDKDKDLQYLMEPPVYAEINARRRENATLPCILRTVPSQYRVKWSKVEPLHTGAENIVLMSNGHEVKYYGTWQYKASLRRLHALDISLRLTKLELQDWGLYKCELINGIDEESVTISLNIEGVVFPYQSSHGRYKFTFFDAKNACAEQDATLATYTQLFREWTEGLEWCNAGWINDGTVHYPILNPRPACGKDLPPGIRSYGPRHKTKDRFDAFCFTSTTEGSVFYVPGPLNFLEATHACKEKGASLARVGELYSSWKFQRLERCDGGWLQDGSVRFPIITPRKRCGGFSQQGVHNFGFLKKSVSLYGAYCYK
ncbi:hyaluronan and proteoglycan link protein 2 [Silurus meridionalis]|uniref:Hyaluronan and proteoglycan link protein 2 n=1 Tax=Silurus meridionalis TaxID=175797 RepID=A0A8T0BNG5_SILME|nr:hyaluronan and proteoglycan link protein 2 [Silurus meridionalis]KAF7708554.1 hypothetical protein HF521_017611 [Silurus meridionalis]